MSEKLPKTFRKDGVIPAPEVQIPLVFVKEFSEAAYKARERVWLQSMDFEMGHAPWIIQLSLKTAAKRGIDTRLTIDEFANALVNNRVGWIPKHGQANVEEEVTRAADHDMFQSLEESGVKLTITNPKIAKIIPAKSFPFVGRNHMKMAIVDDIAWFGGVNVASDHFEKADFMVKLYEPEVVRGLVDIFEQVNDNKPAEDYALKCNDDFTILVDSGKPFDSIIYGRAVDMVESARSSIMYISQLPPSGEILKQIMSQAAQGVQIDIITQSEKHMNSNDIPFGLLMKYTYHAFKKKIESLSNIRVHNFEGHHGKVHAKMLIIDGKTALWGSHNLSKSGVYAGTQEVGIVTTDDRTVGALVNMFNSIRSGTYDLGYQPGPFNPQRN